MLETPRTSLIVAAFAGVIVAGALHVAIVRNWDAYAASISPARLQQRAGVPPKPMFVETTRSARDGAIALFAAGAILPLLVPRPRRWSAACAFAAAIGLSNVLLYFATAGVANLWPLAAATVLAVSFAPAFAGSAISIVLLTGLQRLFGRPGAVA